MSTQSIFGFSGEDFSRKAQSQKTGCISTVFSISLARKVNGSAIFSRIDGFNMTLCVLSSESEGAVKLSPLIVNSPIRGNLSLNSTG